MISSAKVSTRDDRWRLVNRRIVQEMKTAIASARRPSRTPRTKSSPAPSQDDHGNDGEDDQDAGVGPHGHAIDHGK